MVYNTNPIKSSNFLSKATYLFTLPLFRKKQIYESDIYETLESFKSATLGDQLEKQWEKEKHTQHPSLARAFLKLYGMEILLLGVFVFIVDLTSSIAKPLLVGKIITYFDSHEKDTTLQSGILYCGILIGWLLVSGVLSQLYTFRIGLLVLKIKIACSTLVYRKLIKTAHVDNACGKVITLITKDVNSADTALFTSFQIILGVAQVVVLTYLMYNEVGISALIGMGVLIFYFPAQALIGKMVMQLRLLTLSLTDKRMQKMQEVLTAIRNIKMYAWESFHMENIRDCRKDEVKNIGWICCTQSVSFSLGHVAMKVIFCVVILTYVYFGHTLTAEKAFTVTTCVQGLFSLIQLFTPVAISQFGNLVSAVTRVSNFLNMPEVSCNRRVLYDTRSIKEPRVTVKNVTVQLQQLKVLHDASFYLKNGLTIVQGETGTGKTTLVHALLGEVGIADGLIEISGTISYSSQDPWIFPGTVRQNILFGENYDELRYTTVVQICGLEKDLGMFSKGDLTFLTDRGLNLSKGQKTRINLARCVYKKRDIYLLDNCLSALDNRVANQIFYQCLKVFLKNKICVFVTHNEKYAQEADSLILINGGKLVQTFCENNLERYTYNYDNIDTCDSFTKTVKGGRTKTTETKTSREYKDVNEEGAVTKEVYGYYFFSGGGAWMCLLVLILFVVSQALDSCSSYFVSIWVASEQKQSTSQENNSTTNTVFDQTDFSISEQYFSIVVSSIVFWLVSLIAYVFFTYKVSLNIHNRLINKIFTATMQFFDRNLAGNILNKMSRDISIIDEPLPSSILMFLQVFLFTVGTLILVSSVKWYLLIPSAMLLVILYFVRRYCLPTGRSIRRLQGSTRAPVIGHLNTTADGLATIRANHMQKTVTNEYENYQDLYNSVMHMTVSTHNAFLFLLDLLCTCYIGLITSAMLILRKSVLSAEVGLAITQSLSISGTLLKYGVSQWAEIENAMTSMERLLTYTKVEQETQDGQTQPNWPTNGNIVYKDVSLTYPLTSSPVLNNITFAIDSKKRVGVVGRTGAGKTSLVSVLFSVNLKHLRSKISFVPQEPHVFSGSIRKNLDPYGKFSDEQLWEALKDVEMNRLVNNLSDKISDVNNSFSIGQKQLLCLARALLRKNAILVLDEATSNLDVHAERTIQKVVDDRFASCTVITIAHRLNNIVNNDLVLVIDEGRLVEFGDPSNLVNNKNGIFYGMLKDAGIL